MNIYPTKEDEKRVRAADSRAVKKINPSKKGAKTSRKQPEHLLSPQLMLETFLILCSSFMQQEQPQLIKIQRLMTNVSSAQHSDTGPVTAGTSSTVTKSELPEDLLFKDPNRDFFNVQCIEF